MTTTLAKPITKKEAVARTARHKRDFKALKLGWARLGREVVRSLDLGVPEKLGMTARAWIEGTFGQSYSHIMRQIHSVRALAKVPQEKLEAMPEGNAAALASLPQGLRDDPGLVDRAVAEKPLIFKKTVTQAKEKLGFKPAERWGTYAVRLPGDVYDATVASDDKIARLLQVDISEDLATNDFKAWTNNRITVAEAKAQLVNDTPDERLLLEIQGDESSGVLK